MQSCRILGFYATPSQETIPEDFVALSEELSVSLENSDKRPTLVLVSDAISGDSNNQEQTCSRNESNTLSSVASTPGLASKIKRRYRSSLPISSTERLLQQQVEIIKTQTSLFTEIRDIMKERNQIEKEKLGVEKERLLIAKERLNLEKQKSDSFISGTDMNILC